MVRRSRNLICASTRPRVMNNNGNDDDDDDDK